MDDPDLLKDEQKKKLTMQGMPYALLNMIKVKESNADFNVEEQVERKSC